MRFLLAIPPSGGAFVARLFAIIVAMTRVLPVLLFLSLISTAHGLQEPEPIGSIREMQRILDQTEPALKHTFSLTGTVYHVDQQKKDLTSGQPIVIDDGERLLPAFAYLNPAVDLKPRDRVAISGIFGLQKQAYGDEPYAVATQAEVLGVMPEIKPTPRALKDLSSREDNLRLIETTGTIIDYRPDEADPDFLYLLLKSDATTIPVSIPVCDETTVNRLLDAEVSIVATFNRNPRGIRRYANPTLVTQLNNIEVIAPPPQDVPDLERKIYLSPQDILSLGKRKARGEVIAVWQERNLLLRDDNGRIIRVKLSRHNRNPPRTGSRATVFGYPETDQFNIILSAATIAPSTAESHQPYALEQPSPLDAAKTLTPRSYGKLVTVRGTIRSLPSRGSTEAKIGLDADGRFIPVDISACPETAEELEPGCQAEVTGICLLEISDYDTRTDTPHIDKMMLIMRQADDLRVLSRPPWLTPARFLVILGILAAVLIVILIWNASLRVLAERRGRKLARREAEIINAKFKTLERTRLATELHDSVVQNLTGASMEIRAARATLQETESEAAPHLDIALKTINSSRAELRNCIWDLRNHALEQTDTNSAIHITLKPHIGKAKLQVRVNIPRRKITDNEFHSILCMIRELAVNAIRHGNASTVKVAGAIVADRFRFSISDDGCGFDPNTRPGMEQGHFGLEGVIERAKALDGTVSIDSRPGKGAHVSIDIAQEKEV